MGKFAEIQDAVKSQIDASKDRSPEGPVEQVIRSLVAEEIARRTALLLSGVRKYPEFKGAVEKAKKQTTIFTGQDGQKVELRSLEQTKALTTAETALKDFEAAFEAASAQGDFKALERILGKAEKKTTDEASS
jgi:hypothetical protein